MLHYIGLVTISHLSCSDIQYTLHCDGLVTPHTHAVQASPLQGNLKISLTHIALKNMYPTVTIDFIS